jgi:hypothetical protein
MLVIARWYQLKMVIPRGILMGYHGDETDHSGEEWVWLESLHKKASHI